MMVESRFRSDRLKFSDGAYTKDGVLFSGVVYAIDKGRVVENFQVAAGLKTGVDEKWDATVGRVDLSALVERDETDPILYFEGSAFIGCAYEFDEDTGALVSEFFYDASGNTGEGREWFESGQLQRVNRRLRADGARESEAWHENGQRSSLSCPGLSVQLTPTNRVRYLRLNAPGLSDLERFPLDADAMLSLNGPGVDGTILSKFDNLKRVTNLSLRDTGISAQDFGILKGCLDLEVIDTAQNKNFTHADVQDLVSHVAPCEWVDRDSLLSKLAKS